MLNRYLVVTLGGSGEMLARFLTREIERRLYLARWDEGIPDAWRWLSIDVAERPDPIRPGVPASLGPTGTRLGLAHYPDEYRQVFDQLTSVERRLPGLMASIPKRDARVAPPHQGAGQRPQVGHAVGVAGLARIDDAIAEQASAVRSPDAGDQLTRLSELLGSERPDAEVKTTFIVASSLGGGAGAGLLQLVIELLLGRVGAAARATRSELFTVLFTPDVFADLSAYQREGVAANSLYTTAMMLNAHEGPKIPSALAALLEPGGAIARDNGRAADTNFYIGRDNGSVDFQRQTQVAEATAKALARMMVDYRVTNGLMGHLRTNRQGTGVTHALRITDRDDDVSRPVSSLGYASVSLAGDELLEYATQRLAKAQLDRLLRGYLSRARDGERHDDVLDRVVEDHLADFLAQAKLTAQDIDAYEEDARAPVYGAATDELLGVASSHRDTSGQRWMKDLEAAVEPRRLVANHRSAVEAPGMRWANAAGAGMVAATERLLGELGIDAARGLLVAARVRMKALAQDQMGIADDLEGRSRELMDAQRKALLRVSGRTLNSDERVVLGFGNALRDSARSYAEAEYRRQCAKLIENIERGVAEPLHSALSVGRGGLDASAKRHDRLRVEKWSDGPMPKHLRPARNQRLLVPVAEVPALFERTIKHTVAAAGTDAADLDATGVDDAIDAAVQEILTGHWGGSDPERHERLLAIPSSWQANDRAPARFTLELDTQRLLDRADAWVRERRGALSDRIDLPIQRWLAAEPGNEDAFANALQRALAFAKPLLSIDAEVHERVHGVRPDPPELFVSDIPEPTSGAVRGRIEEMLGHAGLTPGAIDERLVPTSDARVVEISSFIARPVHPVVADGLFAPIVEDFAARTQPDQRARFSAYRRTRPLPLFVPLSPERQRLFVRGWVAARILGQLDELTAPWSAGPLTVWTPRGRRPFPRALPIGDDLDDDGQALGRVLEAMPLALAAYACKRYDELEAYMRLIDLGDLVALDRWVASGVVDAAEPGFDAPPVPSATWAGSASGSSDDRRARADALITEVRSGYEQELVDQPLTVDTVAGVDVRREIAEVVIDALASDPHEPEPAVLPQNGLGDDDGAAVPTVAR